MCTIDHRLIKREIDRSVPTGVAMPHHADSQDQPPGKPSNWWAFEREPWKRVNAEILAREKAGADRERADRALRSAFAFAGAALAMANAPAPVPRDRE
jgi:hypothetical protein